MEQLDILKIKYFDSNCEKVKIGGVGAFLCGRSNLAYWRGRGWMTQSVISGKGWINESSYK